MYGSSLVFRKTNQGRMQTRKHQQRQHHAAPPLMKMQYGSVSKYCVVLYCVVYVNSPD